MKHQRKRDPIYSNLVIRTPELFNKLERELKKQKLTKKVKKDLRFLKKKLINNKFNKI